MIPHVSCREERGPDSSAVRPAKEYHTDERDSEIVDGLSDEPRISVGDWRLRGARRGTCVWI